MTNQETLVSVFWVHIVAGAQAVRVGQALAQESQHVEVCGESSAGKTRESKRKEKEKKKEGTWARAGERGRSGAKEKREDTKHTTIHQSSLQVHLGAFCPQKALRNKVRHLGVRQGGGHRRSLSHQNPQDALPVVLGARVFFEREGIGD